MMKKVLAAMMIVVLAIGSVTGCKKAESTNSESSNSGTANQTNPKGEGDKANKDDNKEVTTIKFMHWFSYLDEEAIKPFTDAHPEIKIELDYTAIDSYPDKIKLLSTSDELPDIFAGQGEYAKDFIRQGLVKNLNDILETKAYDKDETFGSTLEPTLMKRTWDGNPEPYTGKEETFSVPFGAVSIAVIYNKNIFDKVGIDAPKDWNEMLANCQKLKEAGYIPMSFTGKVWANWWQSMMFDQFNRDDRNIKEIEADFQSGKKKFTDSNFVEGYGKLKEFSELGYWDPGMFNSGIEESQALFVKQDLAQFLVVPENFVTYLIDNMPEGVELGAFPMPPMSEKHEARTVGGTSNAIMIKEGCKNEEAVVEFLKFLVSETMFQYLAPMNIVPSTKNYEAPKDNPIMGAYAEAIGNGFTNYGLPPVTPEFDSFLWEDLFVRMMTTDLSVEDAMAEAQKAYEAMGPVE